MLGSTLDKAKSFRVSASPVVAAVNIRDLPRYDRDMDGGFLRKGSATEGRPSTRSTRPYSRSRRAGGPR